MSNNEVTDPGDNRWQLSVAADSASPVTIMAMSLRAPMPRLVLLVGMLLTLIGCGRKAAPSFDAAPYETASAAAVLRHVLAEARAAQADAKVGVIVIGERLEDATPDFRNQFADTGIEWHAGGDMTQVWVGPIARVIEKKSKLQPIQLQVVSVTRRSSAPDGPEEVVAAWAYEDRMMRRRYLATPGSGGTWTIQPLETIDQRPAPTL